MIDIIEMGKIAIETVFTWVIIYPFNFLNSLPWYIRLIIAIPFVLICIALIFWTIKNKDEFLRRI